MARPFLIRELDDDGPNAHAANREELERAARNGDEAASLQFAEVLDAEGRHSEAIDLLAAAARRGGADAMARVGARLFMGYKIPRMPQQGVGLIVDGARAGSASAAALLATLTAYGFVAGRSWSDALDWLQIAAEAGSRFARGQLLVLSGDRVLAAATRAAGAGAALNTWSQLRASIDLAGLLEPPPSRALCDGPSIRSYDGFASADMCDWLIARAAPRLERAKIYDVSGKRGVVGQTRTNSIGAFPLHEIDLVQLSLAARMSAATQRPLSCLEAPAVLHYATGQAFEDHYDFVDPAMAGYREAIARDGERVITFLIYLNDDYDGGETAFPKLGLTHKGARGEGLYFTNVLPSGEPDMRALHAGRSPTRGEKWIVSQFIRNRPFLPELGS